MFQTFIWDIGGIIVLASLYLYIFETLPKIRKFRNLDLSDWGFGAFQPFKNLHEYKVICERYNENLLWYKAQIYLFYAFVGTSLVGFLVPYLRIS